MTSPDLTSAYAKEIYQDLLDRIAVSYEADDFEAYARMIRIPHEVNSLGPQVRINTIGELRVLFDSIRMHFATKGITDYVRTCVTAEFASPDEIVGTHETRMLCGAQVMEDPYPVKSHLRLIDGNWWVCKSDNAVAPDKGFGRILERNSKGPRTNSDPNLH